MPSQKEVLEGFARLQELAFSIMNEEDPQRILEVAEMIKAEAAAFEEMALAYEAEMGKTAKSPGGRFEVQLTPEQKQHVLKETGVRMDTVFIQDPSGILNAGMIATQPDAILAEALRQARDGKENEPAKEAARQQAEDSLAIIEAQGEAYAEQVRILREDPRFNEIMNFDKKK